MATYEDIELIGSGGFGEVWKCKRKEDNRILAKKILISKSVTSIKRFKKEIKIHTELDHPNIIKIYDINFSGRYFYIMPYCKYSLISDEVMSLVIGDENRVKEIFTTILNAIEYSHKKGIIHRDLKPENILMSMEDNILISDFGIGRDIKSHSTRITTTNTILGTFPYMSPEQLVGLKNIDERTDIFSLGVLLNYLYTGNDRIIKRSREMPYGAFDIIVKCTEKLPEDRYESIGELKTEWEKIIKKENRISKLPINLTEMDLTKYLTKDKDDS